MRIAMLCSTLGFCLASYCAFARSPTTERASGLHYLFAPNDPHAITEGKLKGYVALHETRAGQSQEPTK